MRKITLTWKKEKTQNSLVPDISETTREYQCQLKVCSQKKLVLDLLSSALTKIIKID